MPFFKKLSLDPFKTKIQASPNQVVVEAEPLEVLEAAERRFADVGDAAARDLQVDQRRHPVEDSGRHEVDPTLLDGQNLERRQRLQAGRNPSEPAVVDVELLEGLRDQSVKGPVADVLIEVSYRDFSKS